MNSIRLISPVDGSLYAERPLTTSRALEQALTEARAAQRDWRQLSIEARASYCLKAVEAMLAMQDQIVPELAWQMGRPERYGAGELRGFAERARHMIGIAAEALADVVPPPIDGPWLRSKGVKTPGNDCCRHTPKPLPVVMRMTCVGSPGSLTQLPTVSFALTALIASCRLQNPSNTSIGAAAACATGTGPLMPVTRLVKTPASKVAATPVVAARPLRVRTGRPKTRCTSDLPNVRTEVTVRRRAHDVLTGF